MSVIINTKANICSCFEKETENTKETKQRDKKEGEQNLAIVLKEYRGELVLQCETPTCLNRGEYLFGEEKEPLSRKIILCKNCVKAIQKGGAKLSKTSAKTLPNS